MQIVCIFFPSPDIKAIQSVAEISLVFTPQIAVSDEAVFLEIGGSEKLFSKEECVLRLRQWLTDNQFKARVSLASDIPTALAYAKYQVAAKSHLPLEAITCYISPFQKSDFKSVKRFRELGLNTLTDFTALPIRELASRFGKDAITARDRISTAGSLPWPRFKIDEALTERADFDCSAQIESLEPVMFLVKQLLDRIFLRLYNRQEKLQSFDFSFHFDRLARNRVPDRKLSFQLPTAQSETKPVFEVVYERLNRALQDQPLEDALEGVSVTILETAPSLQSNRDFFSKEEEAKEGWGAVTARIRERLGQEAAIRAIPFARLLPEASWGAASSLDEVGVEVKAPLRPLRLFSPAIPIKRRGLELRTRNQCWKILSFSGPERISGEWWLGGFFRDYFRVETGRDELWLYRTNEDAGDLLLHGIFD